MEMTEMGAGTKSADEKGSFVKHFKSEIDLLKKRLIVAKRTIKFQTERIPSLEKELVLKQKLAKITLKYPKKYVSEYEYEDNDEYKALIAERQMLAIDSDLAHFEYKLTDAKRGLLEFEESYADDVKILAFKQVELQKLIDEVKGVE